MGLDSQKTCPKCGKELRRAFGGVYTGSDPSVCPILPPYWRCDTCKIGSYDLKTWYNRRGKIKIEKEKVRV